LSNPSQVVEAVAAVDVDVQGARDRSPAFLVSRLVRESSIASSKRSGSKSVCGINAVSCVEISFILPEERPTGRCSESAAWIGSKLKHLHINR